MFKYLLASSVNSKVTQLPNLRKTKFQILLTDYAPSNKNLTSSLQFGRITYHKPIVLGTTSCTSAPWNSRSTGGGKLQSLQNCSTLREIINFPEYAEYQFCEFCEVCEAHSGIGKGPSRSKKQERQVIKLGFGAIWWREGDDVPNVPKAPRRSSRNCTW